MLEGPKKFKKHTILTGSTSWVKTGFEGNKNVNVISLHQSVISIAYLQDNPTKPAGGLSGVYSLHNTAPLSSQGGIVGVRFFQNCIFLLT
ncbi:hypothetical protein XIS1_1820007 [Xenorhabdus innexi]|uniref:Uncharacterized protein n=1 Tax=Xenorhabdus innexi TaxID=290109 RepID=A0A1N6MX44_9GAMM|nr:hypothetical protein XIS1_1820007 [Xenorhabdus innexi]